MTTTSGAHLDESSRLNDEALRARPRTTLGWNGRRRGGILGDWGRWAARSGPRAHGGECGGSVGRVTRRLVPYSRQVVLRRDQPQSVGAIPIGERQRAIRKFAVFNGKYDSLERIPDRVASVRAEVC